MNKNSNLSNSNLILIFMLGSFIGCIYEEILTLFQRGHFEFRRGVLFGPFNPVYGFGLLIIIIVLYKIKKPINKLLTASFVGGLFEYLIWFFQKLFFKHESWNYKTPFVINNKPFLSFLYWGGTSFFHALSWGLASFIFIQFLFPHIINLLNKINAKTKNKIAKICAIFMVINLIITLIAMIRYNYRQEMIKNNLEYSKNIIDLIFNDNYIQIIFPNMKPV